jgi:phosphatidylserine/phosphatidylglycerophosphate/cardiolipin synthase-like enzyme
MSSQILSHDLETETDRFTDTLVREGNAVDFLPSGCQSYEKRWELLTNAKKSINIVAFSIMRDQTSFHLRDLLIKKLREGVAVKMIFDDGVLYSTLSGRLLQDVVKAGGELVRYNKVFRNVFPVRGTGHPFHQLARNIKAKLKRRFHEKYMVVDGREAILGGINWGNKYAFGGIQPTAWRDTDLHITGPVVADIQHQFIHDFFLYTAIDHAYPAQRHLGFDMEKCKADAIAKAEAFIKSRPPDYFPHLKPTGNERMRYIPHKPYDEQRLRLTEACLLMLRNARKYIYWGCHGIRPPRIIGEILAEAVQRGVEVLLITNSQKSSHTLMSYGLFGWMYYESSNHFRWLIERGIKVYEWQKPGAFHSKNMVIDGKIASIGSFNIANGSTFHHTESNVITYGGELPHKVRRQFEIDLKDCKQVTLKEAKIVSPKNDPFLRPLHERYLLIDRSLLTESIRKELDAGHYVNKWG